MSYILKRIFNLTKCSLLECPPGSYCIDGLRQPCPAGRYGNRRRLELDSTCTGPCSSGYYCPEGSISSRQFPCQNASVYCPPESGMPHSVRLGFYTIGFNDSLPTVGSDVGDGWISGTGEKHVAQSICDLGHYCAADGSTFVLAAAHLIFTVDSNRRKKFRFAEALSCGALRLCYGPIQPPLQWLLRPWLLLSSRFRGCYADRVRT